MSPSRRFLQPINLSGISSDPLSASAGDIYFNSASSTVRYFDGTEWKDVGAGGAGVTVSETAPENPVEGQGWFKSSTSELFFWDGSFWVEATSMVDNFLLFTVSASAPADPMEGSGWFDNTQGEFFIYDGTYWQQVTSVVNSIYGFTVGSTPPESPVEGAGWFNNVEGEFYIYDGTYWQEVVRTVIVDLSQDTSPELGGNLSASGFGIDDVDYINFDTTTTTVPTEGTVVWNNGEGTLSLGLLGGNVDLDIGQENVVLCYNGTASAMSKGDVVYINGAQGQKPSISLASAAAEGSSSKTLGLVAEAIAPGSDGFVTTFGAVKGVNTQTFTEGAALWLSTTPGQLTQTPPQSPNHLVFVGYCLNSSSSAGRIFVEPQNGYEIEELHNVLITSELDNDILTYNSASGLWLNQNLATAIGEVDGAGSGIDADLLDGQHGSYYTDYADTVAASAIGVAEAYTDSASASILSISEAYADTVAASALSEANSYSDSLASNYDPSGSASVVANDLTNHESSTTNVHGIADTSALATKTYADNAASTAAANLVDSAPSTLDTLNELAAALNDDPNFATTITNSIATKANNSDLTDHENATTSVHGISDTSLLATTAYVDTAESDAVTTANAYSDSLAVNYDPAGSAAAAQSAAESYADSLAANYDSAGSASAVASDLSDHESTTTNVHGIADTSLLATQSYADSSASASQSAAESYADSLSVNYDPAGSASAAQTAAESYADSLAVNYDAAGSASAVASDLTDHENATTNVHGIADTSLLATTSYVDTAESDAVATASAYSDSLATNYDPAGSASTAQSNAESYADSLASNYDPAGSASAVASDLTDHENATTSVHGIADTSLLATTSYVDTAESDAVSTANSYADSLASNYDSVGSAAAAQSAAESYADSLAINYDPAGSASTAESNANSYTDTEISTHSLDTTNVHGIADTSALATKTYADASASAAAAALVDSAPATLDTLNELAAALGDDPNFATTTASTLGTKAPIDSPNLTGTPTAPTAASGTSTTQIATTEFVQNEISAFDALPDQTGNDGKYLTTDGTNTSWGEVDALPDQSGNDGKYLTTDGTTASWETVQSGAIQTDVALSQSWWLGV